MTLGPDTLPIRQEYYSLLLRTFLSEPTGEFLAFLADKAESQAASAAEVNRTLAAGWRLVQEALSGRDLGAMVEEARHEFTRLFLGPVDPVVFPYQSHFESGQLLGNALVEVREFLTRAGFQPGEGYAEPEDHVALEFEVMRRLIAKQAKSQDPDEITSWMNLQAAFLHRHLLPWVPRLCETVEASHEASLYKGLAMVARGFLELEAECFRNWPSPAPETEAARPPRVQPWQGRTVDFGEMPLP